MIMIMIKEMDNDDDVMDDGDDDKGYGLSCYGWYDDGKRKRT